ncbi:MAG: Fe-S cluster assembly ATPase SufC [Patescibacteria group bacterium]
MNSLQVKNLQVSVAGKEILHEVSLTVKKGEIHAIMGPNGSGKSTLANTLMGHPKYTVQAGQIILDGMDITNAKPETRAKAGLFLSMQYPPEIAGVSIANFLRQAKNALTDTQANPLVFYSELQEKMLKLGISEDFAKRSVNAGFSGGEKKKAEILQLSVLCPKYAILDETDSGLDVDALRVVAEGINQFHTKQNAVLLITHYNRILEYVRPDFVHIMREGKIVRSGGKELAEEVEKTGYAEISNSSAFAKATDG